MEDLVQEERRTRAPLVNYNKKPMQSPASAFLIHGVRKFYLRTVQKQSFWTPNQQNLHPRFSASTMAWSLDQKKFSSPMVSSRPPRSIMARALSWTPANMSVPP